MLQAPQRPHLSPNALSWASAKDAAASLARFLLVCGERDKATGGGKARVPVYGIYRELKPSKAGACGCCFGAPCPASCRSAGLEGRGRRESGREAGLVTGAWLARRSAGQAAEPMTFRGCPCLSNAHAPLPARCCTPNPKQPAKLPTCQFQAPVTFSRRKENPCPAPPPDHPCHLHAAAHLRPATSPSTKASYRYLSATLLYRVGVPQPPP